MRFLFNCLVALLFVGCDSKAIEPKFNLCEEYSIQEYTDRLRADTLNWEQRGSSTFNFYRPRIREIIGQVENNCSDVKHLVYPYKTFDRVVLYNSSQKLLGTELESDEINELLSIINTPLNFHWGETTFEIERIIVFEYSGQEIARLNIMGNSNIQAAPENILMKFGGLESNGKAQLKKLLDSVK